MLVWYIFMADCYLMLTPFFFPGLGPPDAKAQQMEYNKTSQLSQGIRGSHTEFPMLLVEKVIYHDHQMSGYSQGSKLNGIIKK